MELEILTLLISVPMPRFTNGLNISIVYSFIGLVKVTEVITEKTKKESVLNDCNRT